MHQILYFKYILNLFCVLVNWIVRITISSSLMIPDKTRCSVNYQEHFPKLEWLLWILRESFDSYDILKKKCIFLSITGFIQDKKTDLMMSWCFLTSLSCVVQYDYYQRDKNLKTSQSDWRNWILVPFELVDMQIWIIFQITFNTLHLLGSMMLLLKISHSAENNLAFQKMESQN